MFCLCQADLFLTSLAGFPLCVHETKVKVMEMQYREPECSIMYFLPVFTRTIARLESRQQIFIKKEGKKLKVERQRNTGDNKKVLLKVDIAEAHANPGLVDQMVYTST